MYSDACDRSKTLFCFPHFRCSKCIRQQFVYSVWHELQILYCFHVCLHNIAVWYVREGHDFAANCTPVWSVKYQEARFMWKDHLGRGAARRDWRVYGNGTLWMHDVKTTDTDTYHCSVYLPGSYERYLHSVIGKFHVKC